MAEGTYTYHGVTTPTDAESNTLKAFKPTGVDAIRVVTSTGAIKDLTPETFNNYIATVAPNPAVDDATLGYAVGSHWYDVTNDNYYVCMDATDGAAIWQKSIKLDVNGNLIFLSGNVTIGGALVSANYDFGAINTGVVMMIETTTPTADTNYGKVYPKADNKLYFQDGAGVEHEIAFV